MSPELGQAIRRWTGNPAGIVDVTAQPVREMVAAQAPMVASLRRDAVTLLGSHVMDVTGARRGEPPGKPDSGLHLPGRAAPAGPGGEVLGGRRTVQADSDQDAASSNVSASLAVRAGIAASDDARCATIGRRSRGQDHRQAIDLLRQVNPAGPEAARC